MVRQLRAIAKQRAELVVPANINEPPPPDVPQDPLRHIHARCDVSIGSMHTYVRPAPQPPRYFATTRAFQPPPEPACEHDCRPSAAACVSDNPPKLRRRRDHAIRPDCIHSFSVRNSHSRCAGVMSPSTISNPRPTG